MRQIREMDLVARHGMGIRHKFPRLHYETNSRNGFGSPARLGRSARHGAAWVFDTAPHGLVVVRRSARNGTVRHGTVGTERSARHSRHGTARYVPGFGLSCCCFLFQCTLLEIVLALASGTVHGTVPENRNTLLLCSMQKTGLTFGYTMHD